MGLRDLALVAISLNLGLLRLRNRPLPMLPPMARGSLGAILQDHPLRSMTRRRQGCKKTDHTEPGALCESKRRLEPK